MDYGRKLEHQEETCYQPGISLAIRQQCYPLSPQLYYKIEKNLFQMFCVVQLLVFIIIIIQFCNCVAVLLSNYKHIFIWQYVVLFCSQKEVDNVIGDKELILPTDTAQVTRSFSTTAFYFADLNYYLFLFLFIYKTRE